MCPHAAIYAQNKFGFNDACLYYYCYIWLYYCYSLLYMCPHTPIYAQNKFGFNDACLDEHKTKEVVKQ